MTPQGPQVASEGSRESDKPFPCNTRPTTGDPRDHVCAIGGGLACYGDGNTWWCGGHVPAGFWACRDRAEGRAGNTITRGNEHG